MRYRAHYRHTVATWMAVMLCLLMGQAFGSLTFSAYGPQLYVRGNGAPVTQTGNFYVKNPNTQYTLYVVNGAGSHAPVDSAVVSLNGSVILSEQDFNGHPHAISRAVTMRAGYNSVAVQLRSDPGGAISVQIQGVDPDPPSITATVSPLPNSAGWNNTPVTISFSCSDAYFNVTCPAPINVDTQGQNQVFSGTAVDSVGLSATASVSVNVDLTPPSISASVSPLPNSAGWTRDSAVVTFSCGDSLSGVAQCPAPVTVSAQGTSQVNGTAYDNAGNSSQTSLSVSVDTFPPVLSIASPANGSVVTSSALTVSGSVSDASSGVASVLCNNAAASFGGGAFSCNLNLNPGSNTVQVLATDAAGNSTLVNLGVTYNLASPPPPPPPSVLNPPPTQIQITPTTITMAVGERRSVSATDNLGRSIPVSWAVDDSSVLHLNSDGSMVALQAGTATVTATYQQLTAQTTITVNAAGPLALGTERWDLEPLDVVNNWINSFVGAQPAAPGAPDLYVLESTPTGTLARALAGDGHQLWSAPLLSSSVSSNASFLWDSEGPQAGTPDGGLVALDSQTFSNNGVDFSQYSLMKVDAASHAVAWTYNSPAMLASVLAVHPNGDVYAVQTSNSSTTASAAVLALNGATGQVKFSAPMPLSVQTYQNTGYDVNGNLVCQQGNTVVVQSLPSHGPLAVLPDGNVYMEVETTNTTLLGCQATGFTMASYADALELLKVQPSGTSSAVMLEQFSDTNTQTHGQPGQVLPDGEGGILAGWNRSVTVGSKNQAFVSHLLNGTQADYALPWTSTYPINFVMALGEGGTAYAQQGAFSGVILTLDVNSGTANPATTTNEQFVSAVAGGGAILADNSQILSVDANGGTAVLSNALGMYGLSHYVGGTWLGYNYNDSSLEAAVGPAMDAGVTSWPMLAGNLAQQQAPPVPQLRHFLPVQPGSQYSISQVESALQGAAANNLFYALDQANVASFLEQLDKPNDAVAFLGNALGYSFSGGAQSIGLCFASDCLEKAASASDPSYPLLTPSGLSNGFVDASLLAGRTRVVFVASADDGAIFQELWGIDATTAHQALVLPPNSSVSLQQAAQVWVAIAQNLVAGQTVQNAVANANAQLGTAWTVVGDGSVRIKAVQ